MRTAKILLICVLIAALVYPAAGCKQAENKAKENTSSKVPPPSTAKKKKSPKPVTPTGVAVTPGPGYIQVSWADTYDSEIRIIINRWQGAEGPMFLDAVDDGSTFYRDTTASPGLTYYYNLIARTTDGVKSEFSATVTGTAGAASQGSGAAGPAPYGPDYNPADNTGSSYVICPQCGGKGCTFCNFTGTIKVD